MDTSAVVVALNAWCLMECMHWVAAGVMFIFYRSLLIDYRTVYSIAFVVETCLVAWFCGHLWMVEEGDSVPWLLFLRLLWHQVSRTNFAWKAFLHGHHEV